MSTNVQKPVKKQPNILKASCPGNPIQPVYKRVYDEELKKFVVKKVDEIDLYEYIQASASQTDLAMIRKQYLQTGQIPPGTEWMSGHDVDLSFMPHNIHEVYELYGSVDSKFQSLPESTRAAFKDTSDFMRHIIAGDVNEHVIKYYKSVAQNEKVPADTVEEK